MAGALKVNITSDEASAVVQADSTSKGALFPRMTEAQRDAISGPATGLLVYNTDTDTFDYYDGASWITLGAAASSTAEILLTAAGGWPSTTGGCAANAKTEYVTNDVDLYTLDFDADADEYAQWTIPAMPPDWDGGTITATFIWTAASSTGDVIWALQGRAYANDDALDAAWGTAQTVTDTLIATGDMHVTSATSAITLAGSPAAGQLVQLRVYRDADAGGDTLAADARLLGVKLVYTRS